MNEITISQLANQLAELRAIRFAEWIGSEGWRVYDGHDRWICPCESKDVISTDDLYSKFINQRKHSVDESGIREL